MTVSAWRAWTDWRFPDLLQTVWRGRLSATDCQWCNST